MQRYTGASRLPAAAAIALALIVSVDSRAADVRAAGRHRLLLDQQQSALDLALRQSLRTPPRGELSARDAQRIESLNLQQRFEQQQLEADQLQRERLLRRPLRPLDPDTQHENRLDVQREIFAQERQLQLQRFDADRQRLIGSLQRQPLQPAPAGGQLDLP